jgi:uncharacterized repeat protein (TIGR04076 family)
MTTPCAQLHELGQSLWLDTMPEATRGADACVRSWDDLLDCIATKRQQLAAAR